MHTISLANLISTGLGLSNQFNVNRDYIANPRSTCVLCETAASLFPFDGTQSMWASSQPASIDPRAQSRELSSSKQQSGPCHTSRTPKAEDLSALRSAITRAFALCEQTRKSSSLEHAPPSSFSFLPRPGSDPSAQLQDECNSSRMQLQYNAWF